MISATVSINPQNAEFLRIWLGRFAVKVQDRITRVALRKFNNDVIKAARALTPRDTGASLVSLAQKTKQYGDTAWGSVGYRGKWSGNVDGLKGRALHRAYDSEGVGWRSHFTEAGYHSWPKGRVNRNAGKKLGRGWKKKQYYRGQGTYHRGTKATIIAQAAMADKVLPYLYEELVRATK
jgi:hypothetical protein